MEYRLTTKHNRCQMVPVPPGQIQYFVNREHLLLLDTDQYTDDHDWTLEYHTQENIDKLIPSTKTGKRHKSHWKLLFILKQVDSTNITLKAAFYHTQNHTCALLSSINHTRQEVYPYRLIPSHNDEYKICQCKMIAPLIFWKELKNRLNQL